MSLLLLGALLLVQSEGGKPVAKEVRRPATLYASSEGLRACLEATAAETDARLAYQKSSGSVAVIRRQMLRATSVERESVCAKATVLKLSEGMSVEVSSNPAVCAPEQIPLSPQGLLRIRVTSGKDAGAIGCVMPDDLRDPVPF